MATLNLRQTAAVNAGETNQNRPLTNAEVDANFINLNTDKLEKSGGTLTGLLTLRAGAAGTNGAPLRFQGGTNLTTPVTGAMEFDGTNLYFTPSGTRKTVAFTDSNITGNAATATTWATARTLTLTGDVTGTSAAFDGSGNISIATTISADATVLGTDTTGNYVASITNGSYMTGGNGGSEGAALTLAVDATSANTVSKVVARDASGNFSAGTITATLSGNASTATAWQTARTLTLTGDVTGTSAAFDGSGNISIATTIAANSIALGTDTTGDYVSSLVAGTGVTLTNNTGESATPTIAIGQAVGTTSTVTFDRISVGTGVTGTLTGQVRASGDIVAYSSSDERLKKDVHNIPDALAKILKLNGVIFTWDEEKKDVHGYEGKDTGIIAQQVEAVLPEVVTTREDGFMAVKYEKMIGLLIEAIKELDAKVSACTCNK
jgi:hypothetical protein